MNVDFDIVPEGEEMWASEAIGKWQKRPVKLISHTQPTRDFLLDTMLEYNNENLNTLIAYCARVSNPSNQNNQQTVEKLVEYLTKNAHWSPFEMVSCCIEINTTRDIARQILRHRSFSFQEFSQRYANPTQDLGFEYREARLQDTKNRQNSIETTDRELNDVWLEKQQAVIRAAKDAYEFAIAQGIAKEQARAVLPEGLTVSRMYMSGTIRSWMHYIETRTHSSTQKEHRKIAELCAIEISQVLPAIMKSVYVQEPQNNIKLTEHPTIHIREWIGL